MKIAEQLVTDAGFDPVPVGKLSRAREFDYGTPVYVRGMTAAELRKALKLSTERRVAPFHDIVGFKNSRAG